MISLYGSADGRAAAVSSRRAGVGLSRLDRARIAFAVQHEMARRLPDLLFISTYWGYEARWDRESLAPYAPRWGGCWRGIQNGRAREVELATKIISGQTLSRTHR